MDEDWEGLVVVLLAARSGVSVVLMTNANTRVVFAGGGGAIDEREL